MIVTKTMFHLGKPIGKIFQDLFAGEVRFIPHQGHTRLAQRKWRNVSICQRAVIKTYTKESPSN